ncbi:tyrosine-type recombinase/integrase [Microbacterium sp.]|uniref:tyrosine-type recombinase/integrase n=1 Tax=Microbacterium sp. TaxID=51671 RepID=UPI003735683F
MKSKSGISTYSTAKGVRYKVRFWKPDRTQGAKGGFATRPAAKAFQLEMEMRRAQGSFVDPTLGRATVAFVAEEWLAAREADTKGTKRSTLSRVRSIARIRVIPDLGERRIGDLTKGDVNEWVRTLEGEPETIRKTVSVLRGVLGYAVDHNRIHTNPASKIAQPKIAKKQKRYLTHAQVGDLYTAINATNRGEEHGYGLVALVLAYTGLRWSELYGLRIADIDLRKRRINVAHTIVEVDGK